jgi:hypothetical protein
MQHKKLSESFVTLSIPKHKGSYPHGQSQMNDATEIPRNFSALLTAIGYAWRAVSSCHLASLSGTDARTR